MTPAELQASAAAYEKRIPAHKLPFDEKYDPKQPHLQEEAVLVDLLKKNIVQCTDVPDRYFDAFVEYLKNTPLGKLRVSVAIKKRTFSIPGYMYKPMYHKFYNHLIALKGNENHGHTK